MNCISFSSWAMESEEINFSLIVLNFVCFSFFFKLLQEFDTLINTLHIFKLNFAYRSVNPFLFPQTLLLFTWLVLASQKTPLSLKSFTIAFCFVTYLTKDSTYYEKHDSRLHSIHSLVTLTLINNDIIFC